MEGFINLHIKIESEYINKSVGIIIGSVDSDNLNITWYNYIPWVPIYKSNFDPLKIIPSLGGIHKLLQHNYKIIILFYEILK